MDLGRYMTGMLLLLLAAWPAVAAVPVVRVTGPEAVVAEVRLQLVERIPEVDIRSDDAPAELLVAIGARAFRDALEHSTVPVVGMALTRDSYRAALREVDAPGRVPHTALYWDPDPVRQLQLARIMLPAAKRVGIFAGAPADQALLAALRAECARLGFVPVIAPPPGAGREALPRRLAGVLADSDFLLGIEDGDVFMPANAKTILLTAYRHGKPVIGPGGAWVEAGSIASLTSGLPEAVDALADWLPELLAARLLPPPRYPRHYEVATNPQVARSLSILLPPADRLPAPLRQGGSP